MCIDHRVDEFFAHVPDVSQKATEPYLAPSSHLLPAVIGGGVEVDVIDRALREGVVDERHAWCFLLLAGAYHPWRGGRQVASKRDCLD